MIKYRKASESDTEQIVQLRLEYLLTEYPSLSSEITERIKLDLPRYIYEGLNKSLFIYVVEEDGQLVSIVFLVVDRRPTSPNYKTGKIGTIFNAYTLPRYRRRGYCRRLLESAIVDSKNLNLSHLSLRATKDGFNLYKELGFFEVDSSMIEMRLKIL